MNTKTIIAAAILGGTSLAGGIAVSAASDIGAARRAADAAKDAQKALDKRKAAKAVAAAESAVAFSPRNAAYRTLLGQAYLASGRFPSAVGALGDALSLDPADGVAALHLALAKIATGDWAGARETLTINAESIPASDRGLAFALAGDPVTAVGVLTEAARAPGANAKTRQNLALALGLAGRWQDAKTMAAFDVAPAELDARILQWIAFAKPRGAADQVASLLGVTPVEDAGQPERLALTTTAPAVAAVSPVVAPVAPSVPAETAEQKSSSADVVFTAVVPEPSAGSKAAIAYAPRQEIVQAIPAAAPRPAVLVRPVAAPRPAITPAVFAAAKKVAVRPAAKGGFVVQLGAFENAGVARDAWGRLSRRHVSLAGYAPNGVAFAVNGASYYRLSIGGFARGDADAICRKVRAGGGRCFVRTGAGDAVAAWSRRGVQFASR